MPVERVPLHAPMNRNLDPETIGHEYSILHHDFFVNENNQLQRCPGISAAYADMDEAAKVDGQYHWKSKSLIVAVCNGKIFSINTNTDVVTELTGDTLTAGVIPRFQVSADDDIIIMCSGGKMVTWDGNIASAAAFMADADAPTAVVDLGLIDRYILAVEDGTGRVYYSAVDDELSWAAADYMSAEQSADDVKRVFVIGEEVNLLGADSLEWWQDDGDTPFSYIGISLDQGTGAKDTAVIAGNQLYFLNQEKEFVRIRSRSYEVVSTDIQKELKNLNIVDDAYAYKVDYEGHRWIYLTFPTEKKTYVYDYVLNTWHKRGFWNTTTVSHDHFIGRSFLFVNSPNMYLVGDRRANGLIYKMQSTSYADVTDIQRCVWESGNLDWGTDKEKIVNSTIIKLKRGVADDDTEVFGTIQWRDNNGEWSTEEEFSLGAVGDTNPIIHLGPTGQYVVRQYRIIITEAVDIKIISIMEDFDFGS